MQGVAADKPRRIAATVGRTTAECVKCDGNRRELKRTLLGEKKGVARVVSRVEKYKSVTQQPKEGRSVFVEALPQ